MSQTTSADTLKAIALIFNEHEHLTTENPLLKQQIASLEELNKLYVESDSLQKIEIDLYKEEVISNKEEISKLKDTQKKTVIGSTIGGILLFILGLIL